MNKKLRLVVLGMMGRCPFGGQSWLYLNWLRGFARLGHEVWYVEDDAVWPYDPVQNAVKTTAPTLYAIWQAAWNASGCLGSGPCGLWGVRTPAGGCLPRP